MTIVFIVIGCLLLVYLFTLMGRRNHPLLAELKKWSYAHRGLHDDVRPENSMSAFRAALENGYGIELDIHLLKDGSLAVMHDSSLKRTAGADVRIEDLTAEELKAYRLSSGEHIPMFREVLELFEGKAPIVVELKAERGNHNALAEAACKMLESYRGDYCIESFDPRCILWLRNNRPGIVRGQLTENFFRDKTVTLSKPIRFILTHQLMNFLTLPDFVAYKFADRKNPGNWLVRKFWGVQGVSWTLRSKEDYDTAVKEGYLPIFEGFKP